MKNVDGLTVLGSFSHENWILFSPLRKYWVICADTQLWRRPSYALALLRTSRFH